MEKDLIAVRAEALGNQVSNFQYKLSEALRELTSLRFSLLDVQYPLSEKHREISVQRCEEALERLRVALDSLRETIAHLDLEMSLKEASS